MRIRVFVLISLIFMIISPVLLVSAGDDDFIFQDKVTDGVSVFFLVDLEEDDEIHINIEPDGDGNFYLFLFDERPIESHVGFDKEIDDEIYDKAIEYDKSKEPYINYTAEDDQIYYIQIILAKDGPDIFTLECNEELTRYYLPALPGFPIEMLMITVLSSIGISVYICKKKIL